jgi:hypothetical protein
MDFLAPSPLRPFVSAPTMTHDSVPSPSAAGNPAPRTWTEPRVRFWWIAAAVLLAIGIGYGIESFLDWRIEADLIEHGTLVQATVADHNGGPPRRVIDQNSAWDISFDLNGQKEVETDYPADTSVRRYNGDVIPIHVDPNNPEHWTNRATPPPLSQKLIGLPFILGMMALCVLFGIIRAMRLRKLSSEGTVGLARIISLGQSALAPRSYLARCAWADESSPTVYSVFVPRRVAPVVGDKIEIAASKTSALAILTGEIIHRATE